MTPAQTFWIGALRSALDRLEFLGAPASAINRGRLAIREIERAFAGRPSLVAVPGGARSDERPSARYIDDEPEAG